MPQSQLMDSNLNYLLVETDSANGCWWTDRIYWSPLVHWSQSRSNQSGAREDRPTQQSHRSAGRDGAIWQNNSDRRISWELMDRMREQILPLFGDWESDWRGSPSSSRPSRIRGRGGWEAMRRRQWLGGWRWEELRAPLVKRFHSEMSGKLWWQFAKQNKRTKLHGHISTIYLQFLSSFPEHTVVTQVAWHCKQ